MTPIQERFYRIGRSVAICAVRKAFPNADAMKHDDFERFAEHDDRVTKMAEVVQEICGLVVANAKATDGDLALLVAEWRRSVAEVVKLRERVDELHKSGEYAIGKSLVEAIKLANEKSKS
jgi:hypothetical protein